MSTFLKKKQSSITLTLLLQVIIIQGGSKEMLALFDVSQDTPAAKGVEGFRGVVSI